MAAGHRRMRILFGQAWTLSNAPMNVEFDMEDYELTAKLGEVDVGKKFTAYYDHCQPLRYDSNNFANYM
ncbi:hypothetical protein BGZ90_000098 [Linnemannia elongata]|nr:hypothetical protein BGZ90_000098 [Linnemannia elongata]